MQHAGGLLCRWRHALQGMQVADLWLAGAHQHAEATMCMQPCWHSALVPGLSVRTHVPMCADLVQKQRVCRPVAGQAAGQGVSSAGAFKPGWQLALCWGAMQLCTAAGWGACADARVWCGAVLRDAAVLHAADRIWCVGCVCARHEATTTHCRTHTGRQLPAWLCMSAELFRYESCVGRSCSTTHPL